jgi:gliding motility-associated-like protein
VKWVTTGKGEITGNTMLLPVYKPAKGETGEIKFILSGKGQSGCIGVELKDTLKVNIHNPLRVVASKDISILKNTTTILSVLAYDGSGLYKYSWEPANLVVNPNVNSTETQPLLSNTSFLIAVTDAQWGCTGKDTVNVTVKESVDDLLTIYNAISPNGDGLNDIWYIDGIELFPENEVIIFNRWGDKIKEHQGYDNNRVFWDGTNSKGKRVPDGTYYYLLKIKNLKTYTGWIQVKSSL